MGRSHTKKRRKEARRQPAQRERNDIDMLRRKYVTKTPKPKPDNKRQEAARDTPQRNERPRAQRAR